MNIGDLSVLGILGVSIQVGSMPAVAMMTMNNYSLLTVADTITVGTTVLTVGTNLSLSGITTNVQMAQAMVTVINTLSTQVVAYNNGSDGNVQLTAKAAGTAGNSIALAKAMVNPSALTLSGATLAGGTN